MKRPERGSRSRSFAPPWPLAGLLLAAFLGWVLYEKPAARPGPAPDAVASDAGDSAPGMPFVGPLPAPPPLSMPAFVELDPPVAADPEDPLLGRWDCASDDLSEKRRDLSFEVNGLWSSQGPRKTCDGTWRALGALKYRKTGACSAPAGAGGKPRVSRLEIDATGTLHVQDAGVSYRWACRRLSGAQPPQAVDDGR